MNGLLDPASSSGDGETAGWPMRAWGLTVLGALAGLAIYWIVQPDRLADRSSGMEVRTAIATFLGAGALLFAFLVERSRHGLNLAFAAIGAAVVALTIYWNGPFGSTANEEPWRIVCALLSLAIGAPLFQAWRDARAQGDTPRHAIPYRDAHQNAWTNVVLWFAAWTFVGVTWAMVLLLGALFRLIGIDLIHDLLNETWAVLTLTGGALGAGIALLRDRDAILRLLQRVVTTVLAVLAPVLALGLVIFLVATVFTGLDPLWDATRSTSPILLGCVIGALCLANAVIGDAPPEEARHPALRAGVAGLSLSMLPLGVIAAISTGLRIQQYGLTPDRLWAVVFTVIACAYGIAYLFVLLRWRQAAGPHFRVANLRLAIGLAVLALFLSTPVVNFGALSTNNQLLRLKTGKTPPELFDWAALRFDFGPTGVAATRSLAKNGPTPAIRAAATKAMATQNRWQMDSLPIERRNKPIEADRLTVLPRGTQLPVELHAQLPEYNACFTSGPCVVVHEPGSDEAIIANGYRANVWKKGKAGWEYAPGNRPASVAGRNDQIEAGLKAGKVEVRSVTHRQIFVDGLPLGESFE